MKLKQIASNMTLLITNHGYEIMYSYETPVAGYSPVIGYFKSRKFYSNTTSKHVVKYLDGIENVILLDPETIEMMGYKIGE